MPTSLSRTAVIDALEEEFAALRALLVTLDDDAWGAATPCPGWDVRANVAHIIGTESMLAGVAAPPSPADVTGRAHVRNDIGAFNETWVAELATAPPVDLLARFDAITAQRIEMLRAMDPDEWEAEGFTPAGTDTYGRFMRIRVFDCWMHEQDIRDATRRPGHDAGAPVDLAVDEMTTALGFVVGKRAGAPQGSSVVFDLLGGSGRQVNVAVGERAVVVGSLDREPTVRMRMPTGIFTRLGGGRVLPESVRSEIEVRGDEALAERVLASLAFTI